MSLRPGVISALIALVVVLIAVAASGDGPSSPTELVKDPRVEALVPAPGDLHFRQARIGVDLVAGHSANLFIDGVRIPEDQLIVNEPLSQVFFQPGPALEFEELAAGRHCAEAHIWRTLEDPATAQPVRWCFQVS